MRPSVRVAADRAAMHIPTSPLGIIHLLDSEWRTLRLRRLARDRIAVWQIGTDCPTLDDVLLATGYRRSAGDPVTVERVDWWPEGTVGDGATARLLLAARTDDLAARVLLQRLLPGLLSVARRWRGRTLDGAPIDELVTTAWSVIRSFPVESRPRHLVANLLRDVEYHTYRRATRRLLEVVPVGSPERPGWPGNVSPLAPAADEFDLDDDALLDLARCVRRARDESSMTLDDDDLTALRMVAEGLSLGEAAERLGCTSRTVQNHRARLVYRLRAALVG